MFAFYGQKPYNHPEFNEIYCIHSHVVHRQMVDDSIMICMFLIVIAKSEQDMPGIKPGPLGSHISALTTELQELRI